MQNRRSLFLTLFILLLFPSIAHASDYPVIDAYFFTAAGPYGVLSGIITCIFLGQKKYASKKVLYYHATITLTVFLIGIYAHATYSSDILMTISMKIFYVFAFMGFSIDLIRSIADMPIIAMYLIYALIFIGFPIIQNRKYANKSTDA